MTVAKGQLTKRDFLLIEHCMNALPITSDAAALLFYPNKYIAQRRLSVIYHLKQLKRAQRLVANQPYIYYHSKTDIKNYLFTKLLCDLKCNEFEFDTYELQHGILKLIVTKNNVSYQINATKKNLPQVYKRLEMIHCIN